MHVNIGLFRLLVPDVVVVVVVKFLDNSQHAYPGIVAFNLQL